MQRKRALFFTLAYHLLVFLWPCTSDNLVGPVSLTLLLESPLLFGKCYFHILKTNFSFLFTPESGSWPLPGQPESQWLMRARAGLCPGGVWLAASAWTFGKEVIPFWSCCWGSRLYASTSLLLSSTHGERFSKNKLIPKKALRDSKKQVLYDFVWMLFHYKW